MQLSILLPSHRHDLLTCARIAQVCSWAEPQIEVIVRDNSGDAQKRELISRLERDYCHDYCKVIIADPCDGMTNMAELFRVAKGDFVYLVADDDFCFDHAIKALPGVIDEFGGDPSVVGVTAGYAIETTQGTSIHGYEGIDSDDVVARIAGYLKYGGPNVLYYSPLRRQVAQRVFALMSATPLLFSFHDQISCLLYLLNGKFARLSRLMYCYDMGVWETNKSAQRRDVDLYNAEQIDPATNKLHWFLCAFEGAALIANPQIVSGLPLAQRQSVADLWFSAMFARLQNNNRHASGSRLAGDADRLVAKWRASNGRLTFDNMLTDITNFVALFSESKARRYFDFWRAVLEKRDPLAQEAVAASA